MTYVQSFKKFFLPNFKKAVFKAKLMNDTNMLIELQANIFQNWNLTAKEKELVLRELGIWRIKKEK